MYRKGTLEVISTYQQNPGNGGGSVTVMCDCGNVFKSYWSRWVNLTGVGCGNCSKERRANGQANLNYKHGGYLQYKSEYQSYLAMMRRCYEPNFRSYKWYGARGISVCDKWKDKEHGFENFIDYMGQKPKGKPTIGRIDNDGNYEPGNVKWESWKDQLRQTSRTVRVTVGDETMILTDWLKKLKISKTSYYRKREEGKSPEQILKSYIS